MPRRLSPIPSNENPAARSTSWRIRSCAPGFQESLTYEQGKYRSDESRKVQQLIRDAKIEIGTYGYDDPGSDYGYGSKINISFYRPLPP